MLNIQGRSSKVEMTNQQNNKMTSTRGSRESALHPMIASPLKALSEAWSWAISPSLHLSSGSNRRTQVDTWWESLAALASRQVKFSFFHCCYQSAICFCWTGSDPSTIGRIELAGASSGNFPKHPRLTDSRAKFPVTETNPVTIERLTAATEKVEKTTFPPITMLCASGFPEPAKGYCWTPLARRTGIFIRNRKGMILMDKSYLIKEKDQRTPDVHIIRGCCLSWI